MRRTLLILPFAAALLCCGGTAVKPKPGATAGTTAGNGSTSRGASGSTSSSTSASTSGATSAGSTSTASSTTTSSAGTSGVSTSAGTAAGSTSTSTSAGTAAGSTSATTSGSTSTSATTTSASTGTSAGTAGSTGTSVGTAGSTGTSVGTAGSTGTSVGTAGSTGTSAGTGGSTGGTTGSTDGFVRFAAFVPNAPGRTTFDFCLTDTATTTTTGPIFASYGANAGLAFGDVSLYVPIAGSAAGTSYTVTPVLAGAGNCTAVVTSTFTISVVSGSYSTAVVSGLAPPGSPSLSLTQFTDTINAAVPSSEAQLRFIHASPDANHPAVDFGTGTATSFSNLFTNVPYLSAGTGSAGSSYLSIPGGLPGSTTFGVRDHGGGGPNRQVLANDGPLPAANGTASSFFFIGDSSTGNGLQLLECPDDGAQVSNGASVVNGNCQ